jgi:hypothetical protein
MNLAIAHFKIPGAKNMSCRAIVKFCCQNRTAWWDSNSQDHLQIKRASQENLDAWMILLGN